MGRAPGHGRVGRARAPGPRAGRACARPRPPPAARPLRPRSRSTASTRLVGRVEASRRVRAPVPALPGPGGLRRPGARGRRARRARRHRPAGRARGDAHHVRRPRLPQRACSTRAGSSSAMHRAFPDAHVRLHREGRARAAARRRVGRARRRRVHVRGLGVRVGQRRDARAARQGTHDRRRGARRRACCAPTGIEVRPSLLPFTPWTTRDEPRSRCSTSCTTHDLVGSVDPVQYTIRLLLPHAGRSCSTTRISRRTSARGTPSRLDLHVAARPIPAMDELQLELAALVESSVERDADARRDSTRQVRGDGRRAAGRPVDRHDRSSPPHRELVLLRRADDALGTARPAG